MDNLFKNNPYQALELFIEHPITDYSIRGIARHLKLSHATIIKFIGELEKLELITRKTKTLYPTYHANTENSGYQSYKKNWIISDIIQSGLIAHIQKETLPSSIILFGSGAKGTFTEKSDLDIFIEAKETPLNLTTYEKKLHHKINLLFESNIKKLSKELRNNIINGICLYGFIKIT